MNVEAKLLGVKITDAKLITSNIHEPYFFVGAEASVMLIINGDGYTGTLKTGDDHIDGNKHLPDPYLSCATSDRIVHSICCAEEYELQDQYEVDLLNAYINAEHPDDEPVNYTCDEYVAAHKALASISWEVEKFIAAKKVELAKKLDIPECVTVERENAAHQRSCEHMHENATYLTVSINNPATA